MPQMGMPQQARQYPATGMQPAYPMQGANFGMQQQPMYSQPMGQPMAPQQQSNNFMTNTSRVAQSRYSGMQPQQPNRGAPPSLFSNPPLQTDAFSALMMGNKPKKDHKTYVDPNPARQAKKNANDG